MMLEEKYNAIFRLLLAHWEIELIFLCELNELKKDRKKEIKCTVCFRDLAKLNLPIVVRF
jgi:hypothetical protein